MSGKNIWDWTINDFLAESANAAPTPGGGSVSAYAGALGASMVCMVANLTLGKEKFKHVENEVKEVLSKAENCLKELKDGLSEDIAVFNKFMAAYRLPKDSNEQIAERQNQIQEVLLKATESPLQVARECLIVIQLAKKLAPIGNKGAISDVGVAAYLAESALKSAMLSVDINIPQIKDESYQEKVALERESLFQQAEDLLAETIRIVQSRL